MPLHQNTTSMIEPDMTFKEMLTNLFNTDFLTPDELDTICDAGEMYAKGVVKQRSKVLVEALICAVKYIPKRIHGQEESYDNEDYLLAKNALNTYNK